MAKFKPRARAIDLLGRQQIANISTALSELFKNAYDAYAAAVEVDYYRSNNLLLLRDNGVGMTKDDFESRWLTIGTESKVDTSFGISKPYRPNGVERPIMGEKGIGRLAIASIAPQVLVISRAVRGDGYHNYVVSFINWTMFELPGINLDEIEIPLKEFSEINEITSNKINELVDICKTNLEDIADKSDISIVEKIREELNSFYFSDKLLSLTYGPKLNLSDSSGTFFILSPVNENLNLELLQNSERSANIQSMLSGFSNFFYLDNPVIKAEFRDHQPTGVEERISGKNFFTKNDLANADHNIYGKFDEYGNFKGKLSVYQKEFEDIELILNKDGKELSCGPFEIKLGYLQGDKKESLLDDITYAELSKKLNRIGGMYIYRDDIRILPYGRPDFDFLNIEFRRTKHAGSYFFSYRRIIGAISLTRKNNSKLVEKAGREGFMQNLAYKQFVEILENFLVQLAQKYFSDSSEYSEVWIEEKQRIVTRYELLKKRTKQVAGKKKKLEDELNTFFKNISKDDDGSGSYLDLKIEEILNAVATYFENTLDNSSLANAFELLELETKLYSNLRELDTSLTIFRPKGLGLSKNLERLWTSYETSREKVITPKMQNAMDKLSSTIGDLAAKAKQKLNSQIRLKHIITSNKESKIKNLNAEKKATLKAGESVSGYIKDLTKKNNQILENLSFSLAKQIAATKEISTDEELSSIRNELDTLLESEANIVMQSYANVKIALESIISGEEYTDKDLITELESRNEFLSEELNDNLETIQIGLAIKVINHEFNSNIKGVRDSIRELKRWADANNDLKVLHSRIRNGFDHLDNYLNLFTPLEKRLNKRRTRITGKSISDFIKELFKERFERHKINFIVTDKFINHFIESYASTMYPVFINLIDNSIYWLATLNIDDKIIKLDADENSFTIEDSGPGISIVDNPHIFDYGYTKKLGGGGMGLYIAKNSLNKEEFDIKLEKSLISSGARFIISTIQGEKYE